MNCNTQCHICQIKLYRRPGHIAKVEHIFCSTGCRNKYYSGNKNFKWKGGVRDTLRDLENAKRRTLTNKIKAVEYLGGSCSDCGYNKCIAALDFHHINPNTKDSDIKSLGQRKWESILKEIKKCKLLCSNCHREHHWKEKNGHRTGKEIVQTFSVAI